MRVIEFLNKSGVSYELRKHPTSFTAQQMANIEHEPGKFVAKPVIIRTDGRYIMCVLAACYKINLDELKKQLGATRLELAYEDEIGSLFNDCELGAEPPFGNLYDLPVIMDKAMEKDDHIVFQAGTHEQAVKMSMKDYRKLVQPKLLDFSYHTMS
jgi:Ala-tRNA(Pro) deacylase